MTPPVRNASITQLLRRLIDDLLLLLRSEMRLAGSEVRANIQAVLGNMAALVIGIMLLSVAMLCLLGGTVAFLAQFTGLVAAAFIVSAVAGVIAGVLIYIGIGRLKSLELAPSRSIANLRRDVETLKGD